VKKIIKIFFSKELAGSKSVNYSLSPIFVHITAGILFFSWVVLGIGVCLGAVLYFDYVRLKRENAYFHESRIEADELRLALLSIQKDQAVIRLFLTPKTLGGTGGSPGINSTDLLPTASVNLPNRSEDPSPADSQSKSILEQAESIQEAMRELARTAHEQRERIYSIPSIVPVDAEEYLFSSGFGWRRNPISGTKEFHNGLDISAPEGTPVIAPANGKVIEAGHDKYQGNYLRIDHGSGCITTFAHLLAFNVKLGDKVKRREVVAFLGNTGRSTGPHLHYQIEVNGDVLDPIDYIISARAKLPIGLPMNVGAAKK
jgi:murein DD-endopeptidase MepM/ murein hydrolase activator NlpD